MTLTIGTIATMNEVSRMRGDITSFMDSAKVSKESVSSQLVNLKNRLDSEALGETISSAIEDALDEFKAEQNEELSRRIPDKLKEVISKLNTMYDEYSSSKESIADAIDISQDIENRLDKLAENIMNTNTELEATQMTLEDIKASLRQVEPKTPAAKKEEPKEQLDGGRDEEHDNSNVDETQDKEELELTSFTTELLSVASKDQIHIVAVLPTSQCTTKKCMEVLDRMTSISKLLQATETKATMGKLVLSSNPDEFLGVRLSGIPTIIATARRTTHEFPPSANAEIIKSMYIDSLIDVLQGGEQGEQEHEHEHEHDEEDEHNHQKEAEQRDEGDGEGVEDVEDVVEQEQDLEADEQGDERTEDENDM